MIETIEPSARKDAARLPGDVSMWVFILGDLVIFGVYFLVFMVYRIHDRGLFLDSQRHLSPTTGAINTLVLLLSSQFVASGVRAERGGDHPRAARLVVLGGLCGIAFIAIKGYEWTSEIRHGFTLPSNDFFMFYFMLTGVHLFHVLLGLVILGFVRREIRAPRLRRLWVVEAGAAYWHMVDLLWVVIYAMVYLMR